MAKNKNKDPAAPADAAAPAPALDELPSADGWRQAPADGEPWPLEPPQFRHLLTAATNEERIQSKDAIFAFYEIMIGNRIVYGEMTAEDCRADVQGAEEAYAAAPAKVLHAMLRAIRYMHLREEMRRRMMGWGTAMMGGGFGGGGFGGGGYGGGAFGGGMNLGVGGPGGFF